MTGRILLVQHCPHMGGSAVSATVTARALIRNGYSVDVAVAEAGPFVERFEREGCRVLIVPHHNWLRSGGIVRCAKRWTREFAAVGAFTRLLADGGYSLVYANTIVSVAAALAARRTRTPCVWHIRELFDDVGGEMTVPSLGGRKIVQKAVWYCADHVIVNSAAVARNILGLEDHASLSIVPNSVADELFHDVINSHAARESLGLPSGGLIVGVPGTLRPMKGHPFLLRAAAKVCQQSTEIHFAITGDDQSSWAEELKRQVSDLGIGEHVTFLGRVNDMCSFYAASDVISIPSRAEPFGRVAIEAFAEGKAVIASAVGGLAEIVESGSTGILVPYDDVAALAAALQCLTSDARLRNEYGMAARQAAHNLYTEEKYAARVTEIVNRVLAGRDAVLVPGSS